MIYVRESDAALPRYSSGELVAGGVNVSGPVGLVGPYNEAGDICEGNVSLCWDSYIVPRDSVDSTSGPDGPCQVSSDVREGVVAMTKDSSGALMVGIVSTTGPVGSVDSYNKAGIVCEGNVTLDGDSLVKLDISMHHFIQYSKLLNV